MFWQKTLVKTNGEKRWTVALVNKLGFKYLGLFLIISVFLHDFGQVS